MPFFGLRPPLLLCSRRQHRTFTKPLSPSCKAIVQVQTPPCAHGARCSSLASGRPHCCALAVHMRRLYQSRPRAEHSFKSGRALCAHGSRCPSLASGRRLCGALAVQIGRLYRSRHRARRDRSSRDALVVRSRFSLPFFGVGPPPSLCSRRPHRTLVPLSPSCRAIIQDGTRSLCDLVLDALLRRRAAAVVGSRRPQWTFIPLSPSCRVISQVEKRSMYAEGSRCRDALVVRSWCSMPSLATDRRRRCVLSPST